MAIVVGCLASTAAKRAEPIGTACVELAFNDDDRVDVAGCGSSMEWRYRHAQQTSGIANSLPAGDAPND
jgi:hypothetical protein